MTGRSPVLVGMLLAALLVPVSALAADLVVEGCNEQLEGEVGVREVVADVGQFVEVPITVHVKGGDTLDAILFSLDVPPGVLTYVRTDRGALTTDPDWLLNGNWFPQTNQVRIVGFNAVTPIPANTIGPVAVVVFQVTAGGVAAFGTSGLSDGLLDYVSCEDAHGTSRIEPTEWGRVKSLYRGRDGVGALEGSEARD